MKKILFLYIIFHAFILPSFSQTAYWQQQANYKIQVSLNDSSNTLDGFEQITYYNNSPDTLHFIWIHLWANAYKNDRTAYSDQLLDNGRTDFYFSDDNKKGYINRLNFKVDGTIAETQDHPLHQDIIKLILAKPLAPGAHTSIETPFHIKLPFNFSGYGHTNKAYQMTQWYPKVAVYDKYGWHEMPYLEQSGSYDEWGSYEVQITVPEEYILATNGALTDIKDDIQSAGDQKISKPVKTFIYKQDNSTDFVWFADKQFLIKQDTIQSSKGKIITATVYYKSADSSNWNNSIQLLKAAIHLKEVLIGPYPYSTITIVENSCRYNEALVYPGIAVMKSSGNPKMMAFWIGHLTGYNWFGGALANDQRAHPWMDRGMNTYYDEAYLDEKNETPLQLLNIKKKWLRNRLPDDPGMALLENAIRTKKDQPIETAADSFSVKNYYLIAYLKTAKWLNKTASTAGTDTFNTTLKKYYLRWQYKHPYPKDFNSMTDSASAYQDSMLTPIEFEPRYKKERKPAFLFNSKETNKYTYIGIAPAVGYNYYDKLMLGAIIHDYQLPIPRLKFVLAPLYSLESNQLNGIGKISYSWYPDTHIQKIEAGVNGSRFSINENYDTTGKKVFENFYKIVPSLRFYFKHSPRSTITSSLDLRTFFIGEKAFTRFGVITGSDSATAYVFSTESATRYLNQVTYNNENKRVLYPYSYEFQLQQGDGFYRFNATGNYFFNYVKGGGLRIRAYASKFGLVGAANSDAAFYEPKLLGGTGGDDYTYSSYFIGRSASVGNPVKPQTLISNHGIAQQQITVFNEGGLKLRRDQYGYLQGRSANWVAAMNFNTTLPKKLFPFKIPLTFFFDIGTYAEAWEANPQTNKFLYAGGLQLALLKNIVNVYIPFIFCPDFKNSYIADPTQNSFAKKITFSIDFQNTTLRKSAQQLSY